MAYPPLPHTETSAARIEDLVSAYPFAHIFTSGKNGHRVTRLPFVADVEDDKIVRLRAHLNAKNPQAEDLEGADVLVAFSGPDSYVSPNWRTDRSRGATWDYKAAHVRGKAYLRPSRDFFARLINDLAGAAEPRFAGVSQAPDWTFADAPEDYVDRLLPRLRAFEVVVSDVEAISKLHQDFPVEDAQSVADHLKRSASPDSQEIARLIESEIAQKGEGGV